jgi:FlaA1/EpsC-like NDP-sugar epimerase
MMHDIFMRHRRLVAAATLAICIALSMLGAFLLRFDLRLPPGEFAHLQFGIVTALLVKLIVFTIAKLNRGWWTYAGTRELLGILYANICGSALFALLAVLIAGRSFPRSIYVLDLILCFMAVSALRFFARIVKEMWKDGGRHEAGKPVLIYGAGWAGAALVRELQLNSRLGFRPVGFLDDDPRKRGEVVLGIRVLGGGRDAGIQVDRFQRRGVRVREALIAMPSASGRQMREAIANCRAAGLLCKTLPGIGDLLEGRALSGQVRSVSVEDLLGREPVMLDESRIRHSLSNRTVLVTGAAGSIGSELCRQIAAFSPGRMILLDQAESDLFRIDLELRSKFAGLRLAPEIGDIRDREKVHELFHKYAIDIVFHAAAYKHVPLMEINVVAAVQNNVLGTWNLALAAKQARVKTFLMISSDKAVNPANVMGATKRAAELIVSSFPVGGDGDTRFVSVRFGNVLGSNGSVVPLFQRQIAEGGPVTVTHPEMRRYFMLTKEAVQLVLQASTMGNGAEIFVLDMGELVKIADLARNMIRLAGLTPDEEIEIRYTGLRPGEKLYEEIITEGENIQPTHHEKIKIFLGRRPSHEAVVKWLGELRQWIAKREERQIVAHLHALIPEYQISDHWEVARNVQSEQSESVEHVAAGGVGPRPLGNKA